MDGEVTRHLRDGERLLWQAQESLRLRALWYVRQRRQLLWLIPLCLALGAFFGLSAFKTIDSWIATGEPPARLGGLLSAPIAVAALGSVGLFVWFFFRLGAEARSNVGSALTYAATDQRLFVVDGGGDLVDEIGRAEIASITGVTKEQPDILWINRRNGKPPDDSIMLSALDDPQSAKAALESIFPEARP